MPSIPSYPLISSLAGDEEVFVVKPGASGPGFRATSSQFTDGLLASEITNIPHAALTATDVQSALNFLIDNDLTPTFVNVKDYGATGDGTTDDAAAIQAAVRSAVSGTKATEVVLPKNTDGNATEYYCSTSISLDNGGSIRCEAAGSRTFGDARMVFAAGVDGLIIEDSSTSPNSTTGYGTIVKTCDIRSKSYYTGNATNGSPTVTDVTCDVDSTQVFAAGDGAIVQGLGEAAFSVPVGTLVNSVSGSAGNQTLTLNNNVTVGGFFFRGLWRLPVALMLNVTTTSGSSTFTTTGGTVKLQPGDQLWCDAFPWGATVYTVSGSVGAQTVIVRDRTLTTAVNATATHTLGSGKLWKIPAGIRRRATSKTYNVYCKGFPIGIGMAVSSGGGLNATESLDEDGFFEFGIVGRLTGGNNTGGSVSRGNAFANNFIYDIAECGTVGSLYDGDNSNSGSTAANAPIVGNVENQNTSVFLGMYIDGGFSGAWDYSHTGASGTSYPTFIGNQSSGPSSNAWSLGNGDLSGGTWNSKGHFQINKNGSFGSSVNAAPSVLFIKNFNSSGSAIPTLLVNANNIAGIAAFGPASSGGGGNEFYLGQVTAAGNTFDLTKPLNLTLPNGALTASTLKATGGNAQARVDIGSHGSCDISITSGNSIGWSNAVTDPLNTWDVAIKRNAAGIIEVNNGSAGTFRDILARALLSGGVTFANLPTAVAGSIAYITDGATGNCGDGTCTTFGTTVTGGGGALKLLVWYNGTNWTLIGK